MVRVENFTERLSASFWEKLIEPADSRKNGDLQKTRP